MFLKQVQCLEFPKDKQKEFPFSLPWITALENKTLNFSSQVTFLVGENGSGKTTFLEALAVALGMDKYGGSKNFISTSEKPIFSEYIKIIRGAMRERDAFFFRAESFFALHEKIAEYTDMYRGPLMDQYTNSTRSFRELSHGEGFSAFFTNRVWPQGLYLFDEPETALSITKQKEFLFLLKEFVAQGAQLIIATHSPIITSFPNATIFELTSTIENISYKDSMPYKENKGFFDQLERWQEELK